MKLLPLILLTMLVGCRMPSEAEKVKQRGSSEVLGLDSEGGKIDAEPGQLHSGTLVASQQIITLDISSSIEPHGMPLGVALQYPDTTACIVWRDILPNSPRSNLRVIVPAGVSPSIQQGSWLVEFKDCTVRIPVGHSIVPAMEQQEPDLPSEYRSGGVAAKFEFQWNPLTAASPPMLETRRTIFLRARTNAVAKLNIVPNEGANANILWLYRLVGARWLNKPGPWSLARGPMMLLPLPADTRYVVLDVWPRSTEVVRESVSFAGMPSISGNGKFSTNNQCRSKLKMGGELVMDRDITIEHCMPGDVHFSWPGKVIVDGKEQIQNKSDLKPGTYYSVSPWFSGLDVAAALEQGYYRYPLHLGKGIVHVERTIMKDLPRQRIVVPVVQVANSEGNR